MEKFDLIYRLRTRPCAIQQRQQLPRSITSPLYAKRRTHDSATFGVIDPDMIVDDNSHYYSNSSKYRHQTQHATTTTTSDVRSSSTFGAAATAAKTHARSYEHKVSLRGTSKTHHRHHSTSSTDDDIDDLKPIASTATLRISPGLKNIIIIIFQNINNFFVFFDIL